MIRLSVNVNKVATLRNSLLAVLLLVLATILASFAVSTVLLQTLLQNFTSLSLNSKRAVSASRAAAQVQRLAAHGDTSREYTRNNLLPHNLARLLPN